MTKATGRVLCAITAVIAGFRRLARRRDGNVAVMFGLCAIPAVIAAGMAIDVGRAYMVKVRLGAALDAAALAVGSQTNQTQTQLTTALQNYFTANYPSTALGSNVTVTTVPANADLTASVVNFQAQATLPMTFMQLVGVSSITVSATAQTKKTAGLEVAIVLDNTGSMLCGPNDGAPNYTDAQCVGSVVAADTTCTNSSNQSRICTLINAATEFVNTLASAITASQQLYISIVPYVTTVNVGSSFCSSATSCSHITADTCSGDFTDSRGNILPAIPVTGNTTSGSKTISSISPNTSAIYAGMQVTGTGIAAGTTVSSVGSSTQITLSANATVTQTSANLTFGPYAAVSTSVGLSAHTGTWTSSNTITSISPNTSGIAVGMPISSTSPGIPAGATVTAVNSSSQITISVNATTAQTAKPLTFTNLGGVTTSGSNIVTSISLSITPTVGMVIAGTGIPANTAISSVDSAASAYTSGTGQVHICNNATATGNTALAFYNPITYDTTHTATTPSWMGCIVEPTSSDENSSVGGVINASVADPDYTEPASWPSWYPFWWPSGSGNSWPTIQAQSSATEIQGGVITDWGGFAGPNQGCPVPILPLTDVTAAAGKTQVLNSISSMWPRDAGGTQVHIGMIWGWRVLSPVGPFAPNNNHPLSYSNASTTGWKKVVVLMTDGTEEWPSSAHLTGLGFLADGKIGTSSSTSTAQNNLDTRLADVCSNMAASGNFIIYTIGLGSDGASNSQLQNCATTSNGGFFEAATPSNLQIVFNDIAKSLIALRLTQ
jgi:Flp pilus assembly protein TadG